MNNETTDFHEPPKPGTEFEILPIDPGSGTDAVYCCKCRDEGYCAAEQAVSAAALAYSQALAYWGGGTGTS